MEFNDVEIGKKYLVKTLNAIRSEFEVDYDEDYIVDRVGSSDIYFFQDNTVLCGLTIQVLDKDYETKCVRFSFVNPDDCPDYYQSLPEEDDDWYIPTAVLFDIEQTKKIIPDFSELFGE